MVLVNRKENEYIVINIAVPGDGSITDKEKEKIRKYQDNSGEIACLWNIKMYVVPVVVGLLGIVTKNLAKHLGKIGFQQRLQHYSVLQGSVEMGLRPKAVRFSLPSVY